MFQLRDEHLEAFQAASLAAFERRAVAHIRANFPEQVSQMSDDELRERVRDGQRRAKLYGFESERELMRFIDSGFLIGPDFDSRPDTQWAQELLRDRETPAEGRSRVLLASAQRVASQQD